MSDAIMLIRQIVAEETADLRERLQHLDTQFAKGEPAPRSSTSSMESPTVVEAMESNKDLEQRLEQIKAMHRLDASPVQWTRDNSGKMVEAPDGLWEISCLACNHQTVWREGDSKPPQCKTWRIADGQQVQ